MKKKRKWWLVIVVLVVVVIIAAGTGSSDKEDGKEIVTSGNTTNTPNPNNNESVTEQPNKENISGEKNEKVSITEQVLFEQDGIVVTAKEYVEDKIWGDGIKLLLENNSDKSVRVGCNALIVNNYMITDLFSAEVAAGKKANEVLYLSSSALKAAGIETVGQVEIYFRVYNPSSYETLFETECITIQTSQYANMDITPNDAGTELYNADGIRIVGKKVDEDSFWGTAILLYCENNSDKNVGISVREMSINGFMMSPFFSTTIYGGKKSINDITVLSSDLEENGIESIEEVELKFHIFDADSYSTITDSEAITFTVKE